jgi:hypothetical protein
MTKINLSSENNSRMTSMPPVAPYQKRILLKDQFTSKELRLALIKGSHERRMRGSNSKA